MGNYKFRLSNMMSNSWFYKLRDMGKETRAQSFIQHTSKRILHNSKPTTIPTAKASNSSSKQFKQEKQVYVPNRPSYYFPSSNSPAHPKASDIHFPIDSPRNSKKKTKNLPINYPPSKPKSSISNFDYVHNSSSSASTDIIFEMKSLPPILTKPVNKEISKDTRLHRIKVRPNSSKEDIKKMQGKRSKKKVICKRFSESLVVVKKSSDPREDFRESMLEMIIENDIWDSKYLEELLACYLSLNSVEYHDLIVEVFEKIWIEVIENVGM